MSDKKEKSKEAAPAEAAPPPKKGLPLKTIAIVAVLMIAEGAAVVFALGAFGGPKHSEAAPKELSHDDSEEIAEIEIVADKFQNLTTGRVWIWDIAVYVQVKNKNTERVEKVLEQRKAEISEGLGQIISRAQHVQLKEPERQSINRQFSAFLEKTCGADTEGKPLVERVLIPKCRGYPADF